MTNRPRTAPNSNRITPSNIGPELASVLNLIKAGRINICDGARVLGCTRQNVSLFCRRFGINPRAAHLRYVNRITWRVQSMIRAKNRE
jgi:hypothetical protein